MLIACACMVAGRSHYPRHGWDAFLGGPRASARHNTEVQKTTFQRYCLCTRIATLHNCGTKHDVIPVQIKILIFSVHFRAQPTNWWSYKHNRSCGEVCGVLEEECQLHATGQFVGLCLEPDMRCSSQLTDGREMCASDKSGNVRL